MRFNNAWMLRTAVEVAPAEEVVVAVVEVPAVVADVAK
jgi:hypothetical protein